jgi:hypothetical protein
VYVVSVMDARVAVCAMTVVAVWLVNRQRLDVVSRVAFFGHWPRMTSSPSSGKIAAMVQPSGAVSHSRTPSGTVIVLTWERLLPRRR